jgi:hypothetical protein
VTQFLLLKRPPSCGVDRSLVLVLVVIPVLRVKVME